MNEPEPAPAKAATIYDVAKAAGVSSQTVVRYLNGFQGIRPTTQQKVKTAIETLRYKPNQLARALRTNSPTRVLVFVNELTEAGPANIILAATQAATAAGYVLEIITLDVADIEASARTIRETDQLYVAGALAFIPTAQISELFDRFPLHVPFLREVNADGLEGPHAQAADDPATRLQVEHLHEFGHERLFLLNGPKGWFSTEKRRSTAVATAERFGMTVTESVHGDWSSRSGYEALLSARLDGAPTAVVSANDEMALGALCALDERGIDVPGEMSVIGLDDTRGAAYYKPPLTTIRIDFENAGRLAVQRLLTIIARNGGDGVEVPQEVAPVPPRLIVRKSTAPRPH
ncbi:MAG TPA: substrate-binding domain-containing protein [Actinospica sp.]|nr:substrate-binding domain-containing protein [Actinospica sp.]